MLPGDEERDHFLLERVGGVAPGEGRAVLLLEPREGVFARLPVAAGGDELGVLLGDHPVRVLDRARVPVPRRRERAQVLLSQAELVIDSLVEEPPPGDGRDPEREGEGHEGRGDEAPARGAPSRRVEEVDERSGEIGAAPAKVLAPRERRAREQELAPPFGASRAPHRDA